MTNSQKSHNSSLIKYKKNSLLRIHVQSVTFIICCQQAEEWAIRFLRVCVPLPFSKISRWILTKLCS